MDLDPPTSTLSSFDPPPPVDTPPSLVKVIRKGSKASQRSLRARPSETAAASPTASTSNAAICTPLRAPTQKELDNIRRRLGDETVIARKEELLREKEGYLREVVDRHDTAIREKFHLERFVTLITGWDPDVSSSFLH